MSAPRRITATAEALANRWADGETLEDIAADFGVTREAVRLRIKKHLDALGYSPRDVMHGHALVRAVRQAETERLARYEKLLRRMATARPCRICGCFVLRGESFRTCSAECAALGRTSARYWKDDEGRERHRLMRARSVLAKPEKYPRQVEWAKRMLSDNPPPPNRRYVIDKNKPLAEKLGVPVGRMAS